MNDLISRQAAITEIHKSVFEFFDICDGDEESPMTLKDKQLLEINKAISTRIKNLPSAQPELTDEERRLVKKLRSYHNGSYAKVIDKLLAVASAQPEKICVAKVTMTDEQVKEAFENAKMEILTLHPDLRTGKWIETVKHYKDDEQEYDYIEVNCSECGARRKIGWRDARCCPNCGVKIEGGEQDGIS